MDNHYTSTVHWFTFAIASEPKIETCFEKTSTKQLTELFLLDELLFLCQITITVVILVTRHILKKIIVCVLLKQTCSKLFGYCFLLLFTASSSLGIFLAFYMLDNHLFGLGLKVKQKAVNLFPLYHVEVLAHQSKKRITQFSFSIAAGSLEN